MDSETDHTARESQNAGQ